MGGGSRHELVIITLILKIHFCTRCAINCTSLKQKVNPHVPGLYSSGSFSLFIDNSSADRIIILNVCCSIFVRPVPIAHPFP